MSHAVVAGKALAWRFDPHLAPGPNTRRVGLAGRPGLVGRELVGHGLAGRELIGRELIGRKLLGRGLAGRKLVRRELARRSW